MAYVIRSMTSDAIHTLQQGEDDAVIPLIQRYT